MQEARREGLRASSTLRCRYSSWTYRLVLWYWDWDVPLLRAFSRKASRFATECDKVFMRRKTDHIE